MTRITFPETATKKFLDALDLKYIHSFYLQNPVNSKKRRQEIDFIVFHDRGILVLECKGGTSYTREVIEAGNELKEFWTYFENDEPLWGKFESPFEQVTQNLETFRSNLIASDSSFKSTCFAMGCVFPDFKFNDAGACNVDEKTIFDKDSADFEEFINNCFDEEYKKRDKGFYQSISESHFDLIKKTLFPGEPESIEKTHEMRDYSVKKIKQYLYGPAWDDDRAFSIDQAPFKTFSTGILHPPKETFEEDIEPKPSHDADTDNDNDNDNGEDDDSVDQRASNDSNLHNPKEQASSGGEKDTSNTDSINSHSSNKPSSVGMFFSTNLESSISIKAGFSFFIRNKSTNEFDRLKVQHFIENAESKKSHPVPNYEFMTVEVRIFQKDGKKHVGIYLVNTAKKFSFEQTAYQVGLEVHLTEGSLSPQESIVDYNPDQTLFEHQKIYGTGKGAAVDWNEDLDKIWIDYMPEYNVPKIESTPTPGVNLSIEFLADPKSAVSNREYFLNLYQFCDLYENHLQNFKIESLTSNQASNIQDAHNFLSRLRNGVKHLEDNGDALAAFKLMNLSILTMFARKAGYLGENFYDNNPESPTPEWRSFQLAFCIASLPGIIDPENEKEDREIVDLIWFPTGGGKTESYLALLAFTIFFRRIEEPRDIGASVIMRYTLRLLVQDQFSRLASLIISMDYIRKIKFNDVDLGGPITLGLWVGSAVSPNKLKDACKEVDNIIRRANESGGELELPFLLDECPWCQTNLIKVSRENPINGYTKVLLKSNEGLPSCTNRECGYSMIDGSPLPVVLWEEQLLKKPTSVIIGTVDNFAKLAWNKYNTNNLFSYQNNDFVCSPPNLIIQDELHLISGPLGSLVGLYDQLIIKLCSRIHPVKIAVSTATISNAGHQISRLYGGRDFQVVPPPEVNWGDSFFMKTNTDKDVSRKYLGVFNASESPIIGSLNTASAILQSTSYKKSLHKVPEETADPYHTLVWYFNSIRELAYSVASRWDIESRIEHLRQRIDKQFTKMDSRYFKHPNLAELTSRRSAYEIKKIKENMTNKFKDQYREGESRAIDAVYATNMISVGIDIERLGVMMVNGLPKTTAEYIQASSRVGRKHPGLVILSYNVNKSRDRSHYEYFRSMHEGLYSFVEPTTVTPFSAGARRKGMAGLLFAYLKHMHAKATPTEYTKEEMVEAKDWITGVFKLTYPKDSLDLIEGEIDAIISVYTDNISNIGDWGGMQPSDNADVKSLMGPYSDSAKKRNHFYDVMSSLRNVDRDVSVKIRQD